MPLTVYNTTSALVEKLTILDSPFWHNFVYGSTKVTYNEITLHSVSTNASAFAANTDGTRSVLLCVLVLDAEWGRGHRLGYLPHVAYYDYELAHREWR